MCVRKVKISPVVFSRRKKERWSPLSDETVSKKYILSFFLLFTHTHCILFLQEINKLTPSIVNG